MSEEEAGHVVVVFGRWRGAAGNPIEDVSVRAVEESLVAVELAFVKAAQIRLRKAPEDQVALARAAMPGTEQQTLAADL